MPAVPSRALPSARHERIIDLVERHRSIRVSELASSLNVSEMTIRRDLDVLDRAGSLVKVHGGATACEPPSSFEPGFMVKSERNVDEKRAIARRASALVVPGSSIAITAGTTTYALAIELDQIEDLTVVTNSVPVATLLGRAPRHDRTIILTGGVRTPSEALVGTIASSALRSLHVDLAFMGVHGMARHSGFTTPNLAEAATNQSFVEASERLVVLADHTKWGVTGLATIVGLGDADTLVTDTSVPADALDVLSGEIETVLTVEPRGETPTEPRSSGTHTKTERNEEPTWRV